jgi:hypothetical protein
VSGPWANEGRGNRAFGIVAWGLAVLWLIGFSVWFFTRSLPIGAAASAEPESRIDFCQYVPGLLGDCLFPDLDPGAPKSGWKYFPQRLDMLAAAAAVLCGSWHLGSLLLRFLLRNERDELDRAADFAWSGLLGLSAWSLITLALGLCGVMGRIPYAAILVGITIVEQWLRVRAADSSSGETVPFLKRRFLAGSVIGPLCVAIVAPFVLATWLGALLPPTDFDVKAYHLVGPKEWFQTGRITFLPNNVYTNFPFLTEMLCLSTMALRGDWFRGAIAGQLALAMFAPLAAAAIFSVTKRAFGSRAGWLAVVIYLTTPWVCRISIIAYTEGGLAAYLVAGLAALLRIDEPGADPKSRGRWALVCGLFAGSAASCKYPGVVSGVIPLGLAIGVMAWRSGLASRRSIVIRRLAWYSVGVLAAFGPWLLKNLVLTGNPVFPLLWSLFGGRGFDAAMAAKFNAGHAPALDVLKNPLRWIPDLLRCFADISALSVWQSVLIFALLPASLLVLRMPHSSAAARRTTILGWVFAIWLFATWWTLTHRIDRFWVPMLSILAVLGGIGAEQLLGRDETKSDRVRTIALGALGVAAVIFNLAFVVSPLCGFNAFLADEAAAQRIAETESMRVLNASVPESSKTLLVGDAETFDCRRDVISHSVFNRCLFEDWFAATPAEDGTQSLKPAAEIRDELRTRGITHVYVNWLEILRYRTTYGYSEFATPSKFASLVEAGILKEHPLPIAAIAHDPAGLSPSQKSVADEWQPGFIQSTSGQRWYPAYQLFEVR